MTTEKKSETAKTIVNDNKAVFGPLGKYAIVAIFMASIIVTTAIMLDKQLNTVEEQLAVIENEVAEMHTEDTATNNTKPEVTAQIEETSTSVTKQITEVTTQKEVSSASDNKQITEAPSAEVTVAAESAPVTTQKIEQATTVETVATATPADIRQTQLELDNQERIEAYKLEQKQRMAEMFARIRSLESKQLDQYKIRQDGQIARLRDQLVSQQLMIDKLTLRNKELFDVRAANIQRNQTNREQVLNRI